MQRKLSMTGDVFQSVHEILLGLGKQARTTCSYILHIFNASVFKCMYVEDHLGTGLEVRSSVYVLRLISVCLDQIYCYRCF
jgi:hypothetical protein